MAAPMMDSMNNKVQLALRGLISIDSLTGREQEEFLDGLAATLTKPNQEEDAFFAERERQGLGVGDDERCAADSAKP